MQVRELIEELKKYPANVQVFITLPGMESMSHVDIVEDIGKRPCLFTEDSPEFGDISGMALKCLEDKGYKTRLECDLLADIADGRRIC